jgi:hypothetical protein
MKRWILVLELLLLPVILAGCASDSSVAYRSPSHFYYPNHYSPHYYGLNYYHGGWSASQNYSLWRGHEIKPIPAKTIADLSAEEKRRTVDTVNLINLYNSDPNRNRFWWDRPRFRVIPSP